MRRFWAGVKLCHARHVGGVVFVSLFNYLYERKEVYDSFHVL